MMEERPKTVNILGVTYTITYVQNSSEVDVFKRKSLWGQIDYWTRTIRIYDADRPLTDIWQTLLHEIVHGLATVMHLKVKDGHLDDEGLNEDSMDALMTGLMDVLVRNGWLEVPKA